MKNIIGHLPVNCKYELVGINYVPIECSGVCDNCGKIISNIANIKNEKGDNFSVGIDCASTMSLYNNGAEWNILEAKKRLRTRAKFVRWFKIQYKGHLIDGGTIFFYSFKPEAWHPHYTYRMDYGYFLKTYPFIKL